MRNTVKTLILLLGVITPILCGGKALAAEVIHSELAFQLHRMLIMSNGLIQCEIGLCNMGNFPFQIRKFDLYNALYRVMFVNPQEDDSYIQITRPRHIVRPDLRYYPDYLNPRHVVHFQVIMEGCLFLPRFDISQLKYSVFCEMDVRDDRGYCEKIHLQGAGIVMLDAQAPTTRFDKPWFVVLSEEIPRHLGGIKGTLVTQGDRPLGNDKTKKDDSL